MYLAYKDMWKLFSSLSSQLVLFMVENIWSSGGYSTRKYEKLSGRMNIGCSYYPEKLNKGTNPLLVLYIIKYSMDMKMESRILDIHRMELYVYGEQVIQNTGIKNSRIDPNTGELVAQSTIYHLKDIIKIYKLKNNEKKKENYFSPFKNDFPEICRCSS